MQEPKPKRRFRLFRFSLKTLLVFMLISGVVLGIVIPGQQRAKRETAAIDAIEELMFTTARWTSGSTDICYDYQLPSGGPLPVSALSPRKLIVDSEASNPTPEWIRSIFGENAFCHVEGMQLDCVGLGMRKDVPAVIDHLLNFKQLKQLYLRIGGGGPRDLNKFSDLESLRVLSIDAGLDLKSLEGIERLQNLKYLALRNVRIKSAQPLISLGSLRHLEVSWCSNLQSLSFLSGLAQLESLSLGHFHDIATFNFKTLENNRGLKELKLAGYDALSNTHLIEEFQNLEVLVIEDCDQLEDISIVKSLANLREVTLRRCTLVKPKNVQQLRDSLPNLQINVQ